MNKISDIQLYHDSLVSLHTQIHSQLRHLIMSGHWSKGTRIPSETQLTTHLNVSRSTIRLALQQVELEGLIERLPGKGTFVAYVPTQGSHKQFITFTTSDFSDPKVLDLLNGAESEIRASGYRIMFSNVNSSQEEIDILRRLEQENVAGALVWPNVDNVQDLEQHAFNYRALHMPVVFIDRKIQGVNVDYVTSDNYGGGYALMQHLLELGHQHIVFLSHPRFDIIPVHERYRAYQDAMTRAGLKPEQPWLVGQQGTETHRNSILNSSIDRHSPEIQEVMQLINAAPQRPTAIFALNDYTAILVMRALKFSGIQVPNEISVAGFDDMELAAHLEIPLTTVAQDAFMLGKQAAQRLIARIDGYPTRIHHDIIPTQLRLRSSTSIPIRV